VQFAKEFLINPEPFYTPKISISPFTLSKMESSLNKPASSSLSLLELLNFNGRLQYTKSGKEAIAACFSNLNLSKKQRISILTTTGNSYVSRCVTDTIAKFCRFSINPNKLDKHVYVIHEFGSTIEKSKIFNLESGNHVIINDYAYSLLTLLEDKDKFSCGDYSIFSFPKHIPINFGGAIISQKNLEYKSELPVNFENKLIKVISSELNNKNLSLIISKRRRNRKSYMNLLNNEIYSLYKLSDDDYVPAVLMLKLSRSANLNQLRNFMNSNGVESSAYFGENVYFVPLHQELGKIEIQYISNLLNYFMETHD
jgi:hypothetical protein